MKPLLLLTILWTAVVCLHAVPLTEANPDQCSTQCTSHRKFNYSPGTTYIFDYSATTTTEVKGASEQSAKLKLDARAEMEVFSTCEFGMSLSNVQLWHSDGSGQMTKSDREYSFKQSLEKSVLRFSFDDGVVRDICPTLEDPAWALNIKRGVLGVFQNGMSDWNKDENRTETDLAGVCSTHYTVYSAGYFTTIVRRRKDVLSCTHRHDTQAVYHMAAYNIQSDLQSLPIMKTTHECEHSIKTKGLLSQGSCKEVHVYRPFSNGNSGASTTVDQVLTYYGERRGIKTRLDTITARSNLLFEHKTSTTEPEKATEMAERKIVELCSTTMDDIRPETPRLFSQLVSDVRHMSHVNLETLYRRLKSKTICSRNPRGTKFFMDALLMYPTAASIRMTSVFISNDEVQGVKARTWLTSLAFVQAPTTDMLREVMTLLYNAKSRADAMLPISSMVNNFCKTKGTSGKCDDIPEVDAIITSMTRGHSRYCDTRGTKLGETLLLLRTLGNTGYPTKSLDVIANCLTSRYSSLEAKVTAAQAFRRMPCTADDTKLWSTLSDKSLDSELRIAAYLSLMRCPDENLQRLVDILNKEENGNVGSFMYSHVTNLQESSNPHNQDLARAISRLKLEKEFDSSPMKTSINFEKSVLINKLNTGFTSDSNIIWSDQTRHLHSVSTNFSVELFGNSINLLDIGARLDGHKHLARSIVYGSKKASQSKDTFQMSMYGRVFGNEVMFRHFQSSYLPFPFEDSSDKWMDALIKMADVNQLAYTQSLQFLDSGMIIPTAVGFPLSMCVNGTTVLDVKLSGKLDLRKLAARPRSLTVDGEISPSAAVEMNGVMAIDAYGSAQAALRMRNVMHTSTTIKGRVHLDRGQQFSMDVDVPRDKMEVFEARSEFLLGHNKEEKSLRMITDNRKEVKFSSGEMMSKMTGMELVGEVKFPNASMQSDGPYFPMTGPASVKIVLNKRDTQSGYKLFVKRVENKRSSTAQILFNTPGSKTDRKMFLDVVMDYPRKQLEITAISPWKKASFKGILVNTVGIKSLSGDLVVDETSTYGLMSEVKVTNGRTATTLTPRMEIRMPGKPVIQLSGIVNHDNDYKGMDSALTLSGIQKEPYLFNGKVTNNRRERSLSLSFTPPESKKDYAFESKTLYTDLGARGVTFNSKLDIRTPIRSLANAGVTLNHRKDKMLNIDSNVEIYRLLRKSTLAVSIGKLAKKIASRYNYDVRLKSPNLSGRVQGQTSINGLKLVASKTTLDYTIPRKYQNKVLMNLKYADRSTKAYSKHSLKSTVDFKKTPKYNMGLQAAIDFKKRIATSTVEFQYGPNMKDPKKRITLNGSLKKNIRNWKNAIVSYKLKGGAPEFNIDVMLDGKHAHTPKTLDSSWTMDYAKGKSVSMGVNLKDQSSKRKKMNGETFIKFPGYQYTLSSSFVENSPTQMTHTISLTDKRGAKNQVSTVFSNSKNKPKTFMSNIKLDGMKAMFMSGSANLDPKNFKVNGVFKHAKDSYTMAASGKYAPNLNRGKVGFELQYPSRKITMVVNGGMDEISYDGNFEVDWDANKKKTKSQMSVMLKHLNKMSDDARSLSGMLEVRTPFKRFENIGSSFKYLSDATKSDIKAKITPGSKSNEISTAMNTMHPFNIYNAVAAITAKTPFRGIQQVEININHKMDSSLTSVLKAILEQHNAELMLTGENNGDRYRTNLKGNMALKSNIANFESVNLVVSHLGNSRNYKTSSALTHNGDKYTCDMNMDHYKRGWSVRNNGDIIMVTPKRRFSSVWTHKNDDKSIDTSLASKWDNNVFDVKMNGATGDGPLKTVDMSVVVKSPWNEVRDANFKLNSKYGTGMLSNKAIWHRNGKVEASSEINFVKRGNNIVFDSTMASPLHEDITGKIEVDYQRYPSTGSATIQWSPRKKISMSGSAVLKDWENTDLDLKVTTPYSMYRNVVWKASSKKDNKENVLMTSIDTGVRQWMNVETRFRMDDIVKMANFKLKSSHADLKSVDTGLRLEGDVTTDFNVKAEFEAEPHVDKMSAMFVLKNQDTFSSNLFVFTPFPVMPSFEGSLTYEKALSHHVSMLRIECPTVITGMIEMTAKTDLPLNFITKITSDNPSYNNIGFSLQHGHSDKKINSHVEVIYKPGQKIEADVIGSWTIEDSRRGQGFLPYFLSKAEGSVMIRTPFRDYRTSKTALRHTWGVGSMDSHVEYSVGKHTMEVDGSYKLAYVSSGAFALTSTIPGAEKVRWTFKQRGNIRNMRFESLWVRNKEQASMVITNKYMRKSLASSLVFNSPFMQTIKAQLKHKEDSDMTFSEKMTASYGRAYNLDGEAGFSMKGSVVTGNTMIKYRQGRKRDTMGFSFSKSGPANDFNIEATGNRNVDIVNIKGSWKHGDEIAANLDVKTPFDNFKDLGVKLSHQGSIHDFKTESTLTFMDDQTVFGKLEFAHGNGKRINIVSEITTPVTGYESVSFKVLHNNNLFDARAAQTDIGGNVELSTTIGRFGFSKLTYKLIGNTDNFAADLDASRNRDQLLNFNTVTSSSYRDKSLKITTEIKGSLVKEVKLMVEKVGTPEHLMDPRFSGNVKVSVLGIVDGQTVAVDTAIMKRGTISRGILETTMKIETPIRDFESTKFNYKHVGQSNGFKCFSTLEYGRSKKIEYELQAMSTPVPKYAISVKTPYTNYEEMKSEITYDITGPTYSLVGDVNAGNGYIFSLNGDLDTSRDIKGKVLLTTPFRDYTDLSAMFSHQGDTLKFNTNFNLVYANRKTIGGKIQFNRDWYWNEADLMAEINTPFEGMQRTKLVMNHKNKGRSTNPRMTSTGIIEYGRRQIIEGTMQMSLDPDLDFKLDIKSPFRAYRTVKIISKAEGLTINSFKGMGSVILNRYDTYTSNVNWNVKSLKDVTGFINLYTSKMGTNQVSYSHDISENKIDGKILLEYGKGKIIKGEFKTLLDPVKELTVTIKTPFVGFEDMKGAFMYIGSNQNHVTENTIDLGSGRVYNLKSALDYSNEVMNFNTNLKTPIPGLDSMDIKISHEGPMNDFTNYVYFNLPQTGVVEGRTMMVYKGVFDASLSTYLKSSMPEMDNLKLDVKTSDLVGEKKMTTALQWTEGKTIVSNVLYRQQFNRWNGDTYKTDISLTTPFKQIESISLQLDQLIKPKAFETKLVTQMNGDQLLDMDLNLGYENDEPRVETTIRQPWPMVMTAKTTLQPYKKEADVYINWDRDDTDSNINIQASRSLTRSEESVSLEVTHPSRTVGLSHKVLTSRGIDKYEGKLYWNTDDDSRLMYSLEMKDSGSSRRRTSRTVKEGIMSVGLPGRTLSLVGTYSGSGTNHILDTTFSWDGEKDMSKKMELKASLSGDRPRKGDISIRLPSLNKEMKFEGELTTNNGRTILDARTDLSYSQDARKTLTLTSKIEDIKDYKSDFNYSLTLGISHPYTRLDVLMTSHIGTSKEKANLGAQTTYLTARKQMKNMALFAEIDKIKKALNVMMTNPMHSMVMSGKVVSERPYKVTMENKLDQDTVMKWDVTLDADKKALLINTYYDTDGRVAFSAMYPNSTSVLADVTRLTPMQQDREMVIGLNLLSPRLLHTSMQWRPGMMTEMTQYSVEKLRTVSDEMLMKWKNVNKEIIDELSSKYTAIVNAMSEEIKPVLEDLNEELRGIDQNIQILLRTMDDFYRDNELYDKTGEMGKDTYVGLRNAISQFGRDYKSCYTEWMAASFEKLNEWKEYDMKSVSLEVLNQRHEQLKDLVYRMTQDLQESVDNMDDRIEELEERGNEIIEQVKSNPYVTEFNNRVQQIRQMDIDVTPYIPDVDVTYYPRVVADWSMDKLSNVDFMPLTNRPEVRYVHKGVNEVYQQGLWAYKYWQVEKNLKRHTLNILNNMKDIARDEMKEHMKIVNSFSRNPVTVWQMDGGLVEMDIPLPLPLHRLDEMPDWSSYVEDIDFEMLKDMQDYVVKTVSSWAAPNPPPPNTTGTQDGRTRTNTRIVLRPETNPYQRYPYGLRGGRPTYPRDPRPRRYRNYRQYQ